jgi:hemerythrin superfamily protein
MNTGAEFLLSADHERVDMILGDALHKLENGSSAEAFAALDLFWARLAMHIRAEHLHLFPAVSKICESEAVVSGKEVRKVLEQLRGDHDFFMHELADSIKAMRSITSADEREVMRHTEVRLRAISSRLVDHNKVEEERIYPLRRFLSAEDNERLTRSMTKELTNLPSRFSVRA